MLRNNCALYVFALIGSVSLWKDLSCGMLSGRMYDTSSNDTSSTDPLPRKGFLSKCYFVERPLRRNMFR